MPGPGFMLSCVGLLPVRTTGASVLQAMLTVQYPEEYSGGQRSWPSVGGRSSGMGPAMIPEWGCTEKQDDRETDSVALPRAILSRNLNKIVSRFYMGDVFLV